MFGINTNCDILNLRVANMSKEELIKCASNMLYVMEIYCDDKDPVMVITKDAESIEYLNMTIEDTNSNNGIFYRVSMNFGNYCNIHKRSGYMTVRSYTNIISFYADVYNELVLYGQSSILNALIRERVEDLYSIDISNGTVCRNKFVDHVFKYCETGNRKVCKLYLGKVYFIENGFVSKANLILTIRRYQVISAVAGLFDRLISMGISLDNYTIDHKDGIRDNDRLSNLEVVTLSENVKRYSRARKNSK